MSAKVDHILTQFGHLTQEETVELAAAIFEEIPDDAYSDVASAMDVGTLDGVVPAFDRVFEERTR
jgi:hypothetical protein